MFSMVLFTSRRSVFQGLYAMSMNCMEAAEAQFILASKVCYFFIICFDCYRYET